MTKQKIDTLLNSIRCDLFYLQGKLKLSTDGYFSPAHDAFLIIEKHTNDFVKFVETFTPKKGGEGFAVGPKSDIISWFSCKDSAKNGANNTRFIEAFDPQTALTLLDEIEKLKAALNVAKDAFSEIKLNLAGQILTQYRWVEDAKGNDKYKKYRTPVGEAYDIALQQISRIEGEK